MFKSCEVVLKRGAFAPYYDDAYVDTPCYVWTVVDDDFVETVERSRKVYAYDVLIDVYTARGLPVAANVVRMANWHGSDLKQLMENWDNVVESNPKLAKYRTELERYLVLV